MYFAFVYLMRQCHSALKWSITVFRIVQTFNRIRHYTVGEFGIHTLIFISIYTTFRTRFEILFAQNN